ncbi:MAG: tRNA pseudouridine(13) synthase TruD [Nitrososphaeria archaeon]
MKLNSIDLYKIGIKRFDNPYTINFPVELSAQTFFVEEIVDDGTIANIKSDINYEDSGSKYIRFKLVKSGISTVKAIEIISRKTGINFNAFSYFGMKDASATTAQTVSVPFSEMALYRINKIKNSLRGITISEVRKSDTPCNVGDNIGNRFTLKFKLLNEEEALLRGIDFISRKGVRNYYSYQRFGKHNVNLKISYAVIKGYLGLAAQFLQETKLIKDKKGSDFLSYLNNLSKKLRIFILQSYQPFLFNLLLSEMPAKFDEELIIPGYDLFNYKLNYKDLIYKILEEQGIYYRELEVPSVPKLDMKCRFRKARFFPQRIQLKKEDSLYSLSFELKKGEYATNVFFDLFYNDMHS